MARTKPEAQRFGAWLRPLLVARGLNQTDLRRLLETAGEEVGRQTISQWVNGLNVPETDSIILIAQILRADPAEALRAAGLTRTADLIEGRGAELIADVEPPDPVIERILADPNLPADLKPRVVTYYLRRKQQAVEDAQEFTQGLLPG